MADDPKTDGGLEPVGPEVLAQFDAVSAQVEARVTERCLAEDDPAASMGPEAEKMIATGLGFVTRMLRTTMQFGAAGIMQDEVDWGKTRLPVFGVSGQMVAKNFERYVQALEDLLAPEAFAQIRVTLDFMIQAQQKAMAQGEE